MATTTEVMDGNALRKVLFDFMWQGGEGDIGKDGVFEDALREAINEVRTNRQGFPIGLSYEYERRLLKAGEDVPKATAWAQRREALRERAESAFIDMNTTAEGASYELLYALHERRGAKYGQYAPRVADASPEALAMLNQVGEALLDALNALQATDAWRAYVEAYTELKEALSEHDEKVYLDYGFMCDLHAPDSVHYNAKASVALDLIG